MFTLPGIERSYKKLLKTLGSCLFFFPDFATLIHCLLQGFEKLLSFFKEKNVITIEKRQLLVFNERNQYFLLSYL